MMILLSLIAVGLLSLSSVSIRSANLDHANQEARANARLALIQAIAALQKHAGPDQRATATSGVLDGNVGQGQWVGVWSTQNEDSLPFWLVSGNELAAVDDLSSLNSYPANFKTPDSQSGSHFAIFSETENSKKVEVPFVSVTDSLSERSGRYAWWVSDEGTKARIDIEAPEEERVTNSQRVARSQLAQEANLARISKDFEAFLGSDSERDVETLVSLATADLALAQTGEGKSLSSRYGHDLTVGGYGLPVNVVDGGMKSDLSVVFDSSQQSNLAMVREVMGASPARKNTERGDGKSFYPMSRVSSPEKFYLDQRLTEISGKDVGPNWGILYNYGRLWENVSAESIGVSHLYPKLEINGAERDWAPYTNFNEGNWRRDIQHINSGAAPVLCMMQMGVRLKARRDGVIEDSTRPVPAYRLQLQLKPVLGFWNPYNVKLQPQTISVKWYVYPNIRLGADTPSLPGYGEGGTTGRRWYRTNIWLRELWASGGTSLTRFNLRIQNAEFQPGEIRYFSIEDDEELITKPPSGVNWGSPTETKHYTLSPGWHDDGGFTFDLVFPAVSGATQRPFQTPGQPFRVPAGSDVHHGYAYLDDSVLGATRDHFTELSDPGRTSCGIEINMAGNNVGPRLTDIWLPQNLPEGKLKYSLPEVVIGGYARGIGNEQIPIERLERTPSHISTWRIVARTAADAIDAEAGAGSQKIRGWIDTNPRYAAMNSRWDGSRIVGSKQDGLHFASPYLGETYGDSYDGGPGGRGKVAEGRNQRGVEPEVDNTRGRYQGFGGNSTSSFGGSTHVPLFDIPRGPLVSLGQFQHAQLSRYGYEPSFPFGNSHANIRIPLGQRTVANFADIPNFTMSDISYAVNEAIWDGNFFSTIGVDYDGGGSTLDSVFPPDELAKGTRKLTNHRHRFIPLKSGEGLDDLIKDAGSDGARAIASRIAIDGAFNVNSTSKEAWKAIFSSMENFEFPVIDESGDVSWEKEGGIRFPRFGHVMQEGGWSAGDGSNSSSFWKGYRRLSENDLDDLAASMVEEIQERGPFRSLAEFVNRDPESSQSAHQSRGALQAALDKSANADLVDSVGDEVDGLQGDLFQNEVLGIGSNSIGKKTSELTSGGFAGYIMQGDVLQSLAPLLQVRSDYFRVRAAGQSLDKSGKVLVTAVCEAFVQRTAEFVNPTDEPHLRPDEMSKEENKNFGRRFRVVSFRWLSPSEV
ncbi:hypothetical protein [Roseibacillus persicicus]|uniref:hypothetical protein n=1 Tax=Roseibacillus persicicus TaxID=454148 RepID=UPI00280DD36E|nr:hypothetical protein [Roseibacillus persicicus]MDQ8190079.1 hypothetical protein [Roseibacillus persicicus]